MMAEMRLSFAISHQQSAIRMRFSASCYAEAPMSVAAQSIRSLIRPISSVGGLKIRTTVKAGEGRRLNHNETLIRGRSRARVN
jgi:hypothetical protein